MYLKFTLVCSRVDKLLSLVLILSHLKPLNALTFLCLLSGLILASSLRLERTVIIEVCHLQPEPQISQRWSREIKGKVTSRHRVICKVNNLLLRLYRNCPTSPTFLQYWVCILKKKKLWRQSSLLCYCGGLSYTTCVQGCVFAAAKIPE